jgi:glyoxylase-like metal-dependent hydrolase (beta-lactamase superfamily II)
MTDGAAAGRPEVTGFFDAATWTAAFVVADPRTRHCAIIDSVLDYDPKSGRTATKSADRIRDFVRAQGLTVDWNLETHVHADHLTAASYMKSELNGKVAIGARVTVVQANLARLYNAEAGFRPDGSQFDHLFEDGETFAIGKLKGRVLYTPGHTPDSVSYLIGDAVFVGDTVFMPDYGTARCDFPGGDARVLHESVQRLYALPDETRLFVGHDYGTEARADYAWETTIGDQKRSNIHIRSGVAAAEFAALRDGRDAKLGYPVLFHPSVQVNMRAGHLPPAEANGTTYLKIPVNAV